MNYILGTHNMNTVDGDDFTPNEPIYSRVFNFEKNFSPKRARQWINEYQSNGIVFCVIYVFLILSIRFHMRNKHRYELRTAWILWNTALSIISILGSLRSVPELYHMLTKYDLYHSVCYPPFLEPNNVTEFWAWLFTLSKILELGDTMFIVLRKQPLIFLHWYHHVTVLLVTLRHYGNNSANARWFISMNYSVHSLMYPYYTTRAIGFSVPKFITITITLLQILQMSMGCVITGLAYYYRSIRKTCLVSNWDVTFMGSVYFSYLILFVRLLYKVYIKPSRKTDNIKVKSQ